MDKIRRFILMIGLAIAISLLSACASPATVEQPSISPVPVEAQETEPAQTQKVVRSYMIRVTGYYLVLDKNPEEQAELDAHLDKVLAMSQEEYDHYKADNGPAKFYRELAEKYPITSTKVPTIKFSGSYMVVKPDGTSSSRSVDGTTPAEYYIGSAEIISCTFQKSGEGGRLTVEILYGDDVVASEWTSADYGVVSVAR